MFVCLRANAALASTNILQMVVCVVCDACARACVSACACVLVPFSPTQFWSAIGPDCPIAPSKFEMVMTVSFAIKGKFAESVTHRVLVAHGKSEDCQMVFEQKSGSITFSGAACPAIATPSLVQLAQHGASMSLRMYSVQRPVAETVTCGDSWATFGFMISNEKVYVRLAFHRPVYPAEGYSDSLQLMEKMRTADAALTVCVASSGMTYRHAHIRAY